MNTRAIGKFGEEVAGKYLCSKGYKLLNKNWTCYGGELDIVTKSPNAMLTFVEVKYIGLFHYCTPEEMLTSKKIRHLLRTINTYLLKNSLDPNNWRLDLVCLSRVPGRILINHYEDVLFTNSI